MVKQTKSKRANSTKHAPLAQTIIDASHRSKFATSKRSADTFGADGKDAGGKEDEAWLDEKTSKRILDLTARQQTEIDREITEKSNAVALRNPKVEYGDSEEEESDDGGVDNGGSDNGGAADGDGDNFLAATSSGGYVTVDTGLSPSEEAHVASLMGNGGAPRRTLADMIMAKIEGKEAAAEEAAEEGGGEEVQDASPFPEKVVSVYTDIGTILKR